MLRSLGIILLCIAAAIGYGLIHDQITIRVGLEYFTVLHPQILPKDTSPTVLALAWGVLATWWVGLILGVIVAIACGAGSRPKLSASDMLRPVGILLLVMAAGATLAGVVGYEMAINHPMVSTTFKDEIPVEHQSGVIADGFTHVTSYAIGFIGGIIVAIQAWIRRGKLARAA